MTIDVWAQHPTAEFLAESFFDSLRRWTDGAIPTKPPALSATIEAMDGGGVDRALLSAWHGPRGPLIPNRTVADWVSQFPDRLSGLASVDLTTPLTAVREIRRAIHDDGFKGVRVVPWLWGLPPTDRLYYPIYTACAELEVPFCTQVGHTGALRPSETGRPIPYIDQIALDFPELTIVCGHLGYSWTDEMIAVARKHPNVYIDTSAYTTKRLPTELVTYLKSRSGRRKVLFGSNYPMLNPAHALAGISELNLDDETKHLYMHGNAARVFNIN